MIEHDVGDEDEQRSPHGLVATECDCGAYVGGGRDGRDGDGDTDGTGTGALERNHRGHAGGEGDHDAARTELGE